MFNKLEKNINDRMIEWIKRCGKYRIAWVSRKYDVEIFIPQPYN